MVFINRRLWPHIESNVNKKALDLDSCYLTTAELICWASKNVSLSQNLDLLSKFNIWRIVSLTNLDTA